jgi:hypothetical protein
MVATMCLWLENCSTLRLKRGASTSQITALGLPRPLERVPHFQKNLKKSENSRRVPGRGRENLHELALAIPQVPEGRLLVF